MDVFFFYILPFTARKLDGWRISKPNLGTSSELRICCASILLYVILLNRMQQPFEMDKQDQEHSVFVWVSL